MEGMKESQTLFYRTLPITARCPIIKKELKYLIKLSTHVIGEVDCRMLCDITKISVIKLSISQTNL